MLDDVSDPKELIGSRVTGNRGTDLGEVDAVYLDEETQRPEWVAVTTGMFGADVSVVPLAEAAYSDGVLRLPYTRDQVRNAPHQPADRQLTPEDELVLIGHYGTDHHASGHLTPDRRQE
jgi:sporulation protein YlmC with PRC-barrel domain